jgi:flagellar motor switch protein FliM
LKSVDFVIVLNPVAAQRYMARASKRVSPPVDIVPLKRALVQQSVVLNVFAGSAELTLTELRALGVGDVIRLDRQVAAPLVVGVDEGSTVCGAYLGAMQGCRAIQITDLRNIDEV